MEGSTVTAVPDLRAAATRPRIDTLFQPRVVMIGASTGGPQALIELLGRLQPAVPHLAVCVTLHMPPDLVPVIASHVTHRCGLATRVIRERGPLERGLVHFASGDRHMAFARAGQSLEVAPTQATQRDFCKPAVDAMFISGAGIHGRQAFGIVLSGMGTDGLAGARAIVAAGGIVLVQDKESSAVWGMPGAVAKANLATAVLSPSAIATDIMHRIRFVARSP